MKLRLLHIIILLTALTCEARADNLGYTNQNPLVFAIDMDYAPMEYVDEQGRPCGLDVEYTSRLMERLNIPVRYSPNTWEAVADDILKGRVDLGMMVYSPYRKDITNYSRAVFRLYYQMITRKGSPHNVGLRQVKGKEVAFMKSRPIIDTLTALGANIVLVKDLKKTLYELAGGKYDAVICFRYQAHYLIDHHQLENLQTEELTLMPREYCYVSNNKKLIDTINEELEKMDEEGIVDEVYGNLRTHFDQRIIPEWVWYLLAGIIAFSLLVIIHLQGRNRKRLMQEIERTKKSEEEARASEERARKSDELKTIFMSNVSHALRTPLNAIIGFSDLLLTSPDDIPRDEQQHLMGLINENGLQLLHLINQLLSLSDLSDKGMMFNMEVTDIVAEFDKYVAEIRPQLHPGVELVVEEPIGGIRAMVDKKFMRMVNMHLLENAVQHTTEGKITLSYYVKQGGIYAEVRDTGTGLPPNLKENIFALLNDKNTYIQNETPGLGLSICKAICDKLGGQIGARDNDIDGRGTIIWTWAEVQLV